ncbi:MAG: hypothetical protein GWN00_06870 [Aliifodinibius sp.]|nr:hypothetical protein [Fodinibius sp.]NIY24540.1 hypothetical protein [Fodinibius sp.]
MPGGTNLLNPSFVFNAYTVTFRKVQTLGGAAATIKRDWITEAKISVIGYLPFSVLVSATGVQ